MTLTFVSQTPIMQEAWLEPGFPKQRQPVLEANVSNTDFTRAAAQSQTVEYRDIPGFIGYRVGNDGSVWSNRNRHGTVAWHRLRPGANATGHLSVRLHCGSGNVTKRLVHRLVLEAFVGPCPEGMEGCHYPDRNPGNCRLENLRWDTRSNNWEDARKHGTAVEGERCGTHKLKEAQVLEIKRLIGTVTMQSLADRFGVTIQAIFGIKTGKSWAWLNEDTKQ